MPDTGPIPKRPREVATARSAAPPGAGRAVLPGATVHRPPDGGTVTRQAVERSYRTYAPVYDWVFGRSLGPGRVAMARLVCELAPPRILEVGVGTGLALASYPREAQVTGIDVSEEMLAVARRRVGAADAGRITLQRMDAEAMDFADASFDCVTLPYVLSVTPHPDRLVAEARRVCKPGGDIVIVNHFSGQRGWRWLERLAEPLSVRLGFRTRFDLDQHVHRHDWQVLSIEPTNVLSLSRLIHVRNARAD